MQPLERSLRNKLESTVKEARDVAENAARAALEHLGVSEPTAASHLSGIERELRRKLRIHGRQLGDIRNEQTGVQELDRLIDEVAYEHWHRMLFARFLEANGLLMYWPKGESTPIDVDLETCQALLDEGVEQAVSVWELAGRFASRMLPQIFRQDSPLLQLMFPPEYQQKLEHLVAELPSEMFHASDSLGWVYQYWQAKRKEAVNSSEVKIGARELPAVTQLFTEPYMVSFLLDNALGAWWAAKRLSDEDLKILDSEEALRQRASIPGVPLSYLRFVRQEDGTWHPAAGAFEQWPQSLSELKTLDPCCGSGHFLVAAFLMLVPMRMELEGMSPGEAVGAVLRQNLHGLELDQRCVELAAFALALEAWRYPGAGGFRPLPEMHLACSGLAPSVAKEEWKQLGLGKRNLTIALDWMYEVFKDAPILGSLINPSNTVDSQVVQWDELSGVLEQALLQEKGETQQEVAVVAQGLAKAATLLAGKYHWVITNVPYLARGKQCKTLRDFCNINFMFSKNDLATIFLERCIEFFMLDGTISIVMPQNWLFLPGYRKLREKLLNSMKWNFVARLGAQAFQTPMWDFNVQLLTISKKCTCRTVSALTYSENAHNIFGLDVSQFRSSDEKAIHIIDERLKCVVQQKQLENPESRITLDDIADVTLLANSASSIQGLATSDDMRFTCLYWEQKQLGSGWEQLRGTVATTTHYSGCERLLLWEDGNGQYYKHAQELKLEGRLGGWKSGTEARGKQGIIVSQMNNLPVSLYLGEFYDHNACVVLPINFRDLSSIWLYLSSERFYMDVRLIDQSLKPSNNTLLKIPFDNALWERYAVQKYPKGLPQPYSDDPTQWLFHGHPCGSVIWDEEKKWTSHGSLRTDETVLQVAVARLLGYRWPAELDENMELADEQREWVNRCASLLPFADDDGIVCIPPVRGESSASDRLLNLLAAAYGDAWNGDVLAALLQSVDHADKSLDTWLREKYFAQHCKLFQQRPFIWHIWDGLRDGFSVLVNYHKLDRKKLETLIYTYLGDWILRQKQDIANGVDGAQERLAAAEILNKRLEMILQGEAPYDIFVRWKSLREQPIGWDPDINDGVRLNIRPFISVPDVAKKGAGVLRDAPKINWNKDRGKDVASAPWYHVFKGDRINDHHISLAEKHAARGEVYVE